MPPGKNPPYRASEASGAPPVLAPPTVKPPEKKGQGEAAVFEQFIRTHKGMRPWKDLIWNAVGRFGGITATELAAVIWAESKGKKNARNASGALGLGQILDGSANPVNAVGVPFFRDNLNISEADKLNPAFAIQYMAWRLGGYAAANGGTIDDVWRNGYGGDQPGTYVSQYLPASYVGRAGQTAAGKAGESADTAAVAEGMRDPWVVGVSANGKLKVVKSSVVPKNAVLYDGLPMKASDWQSLRRGLDRYFVSYTGGRPDNKMIMTYLQKGWSEYSLTVALSKSKGFFQSPIYKSQAPQYQEAARDLLGQGQKAPADLIRSAIVNSWTAGAFQAVLRAKPEYVQSNEFKGNTATLLNVHSSIMGIPDKKAQGVIQQAALAGWSPDQYAAYLRGTDEYVQSPEYQTKTLNFLTSLGLITGEQAVLRKGQVDPARNPNPKTGALPTDKRLPAGSLTAPEDTIAGYG